MNIANLLVGRNYMDQSTTNLATSAWFTVVNFVAAQMAMVLSNSIVSVPQKKFTGFWDIDI